MEVVPLALEEVLPLRRAVLWPEKPLDFCRVSGDKHAEHFGIKLDDHVVCVASVFLSGREARLRKFATAKEYQGRGMGSKVLQYLIQRYRQKDYQQFWFDAREEAIPFYQKFGFAIHGARFYKSDIAYFKMAKSLSNAPI